MMFTVALIGPDGAGKTTIGRLLERELPLPVKYVYMGVNSDASNHMLPTSRLLRTVKRACGFRPPSAGPRDPQFADRRQRGFLREIAVTFKSLLGLANRLAEEWYRQAVSWYYKRRRFIVLFDRHYFPDYYAYDIVDDGRPKPLARRIHGFFLSRIYPKPDLFIYLDAPAEVLLARKGEGTLEILERRRTDYLQIGKMVKHFAVVDTSRTQAEAVGAVRDLIWDFYRRYRDGSPARFSTPEPRIEQAACGTRADLP